ncbi:MAG: LPXTG cell wall anchor domain-containing protein, partial [Clostridia bacterium]|nr:LPXTG cell wall anchor domain-containing protein [Clostridia bacterium]
YADLAIEKDGIYLVIEKHNTEKVAAPVDPFYITIPWPVEKEIKGENGTEVVIEYEYIVSLYPKNKPTEPPVPPPPPPPEEVKGCFKVIKYDFSNENTLLSGAQFMVYRPATAEDTNVELLLCDGIQCAVVPVVLDGEQIILTTDETGMATSPELEVGVYYVKEIKAPEGYMLRHDIIAVNVVSGTVQKVVDVRVGNTHGSELPATGGMGVVPFVLGGVILMLLAVSVLFGKYAYARICVSKSK